MIEALDYFRELTTFSVLLRMAMATVLGGLIGLDRGKKRRAAGFRTHILVCLGAVLSMLLGQYNCVMLGNEWSALATEIGVKTDISRMGAQVINGIGFLGAGTIIVTKRQEVKGLTTAAGLWASACAGLAIGAGFYECVLVAFLLIIIVIRCLPYVEGIVVNNARNMNFYVDFASLDDLGKIIAHIKEQNVHIYEVDIDHGRNNSTQRPNAVFSIRLKQKRAHIQVLTAIAELGCIYSIEEI